MTTTASPLPAAQERPLRLAPPTTRLPLSRMELFAGLPERDLEMLECRLGVVRWPNGADTPEPLERPDHLYLVREGRLAMFERTGPGHRLRTDHRDRHGDRPSCFVLLPRHGYRI